MKRKILFIVFLILDLVYTYLQITGRAHFMRRGADSLLLTLYRYVVIASPFLVHLIPGGEYGKFDESKKYMLPLIIILIINLIMPMYIK